jgi:HemX protein
MSIAILRAAAVLYAASAVLYVGWFARPRHLRLVTAGFWALAAAFVVHAAAIGTGCKELGGTEFFSLRGGLLLGAWLAAGAYLLLHRAYKAPALGAFVVPLLLVVIIPSTLIDPAQPDVAPEVVRHAAFHVVVAILAVALFTIACGAAFMYLLQEREVKGKRFGALFSRLPSLESLDRLNQRLVRAGFVAFTVALLAGTLNAAVLWKSAWSWDLQQITSVLVWLVYGAMVQLRRAGWHGHRYAVLTLIAFVILAGAMGTVEAFPGATRHSGNYGAEASAGGAR